ncbi:MAG: DUF4912 domain-containing protein [bacterium]
MPLIKKTTKTPKEKVAPKKKVAAVKKVVEKKPARKRSSLINDVSSKIPKQKKLAPNTTLTAEASKYFLAEPDQPNLSIQSDFIFPAGYGDNRIVLMVRDPNWAYTYWEISSQRLQEIAGELGKTIFNRSQKILRVYDTENWRYFDVDINSEAINWYLKMPETDHSYCVEIGFVTPDGRFIAAARSNCVTMPRDKASDLIDENWVPGDWDNIYSLSGGHSARTGSFSWLSSFSLQRH